MYRKNTLVALFALAASAMAMVPAGNAAGYLDDLEFRTGETRIVNDGDKPTLSGAFLSAQAAAANNDEAAAVESYREAITLDPQNGQLKQSLFVALTANGQIEEAVALLPQIPEEDANPAVNGVVSAADAMKRKSWNRVLQNIDKLDGSDLDNLLANLVGAWARVGSGKIDAALERTGGIAGPEWTEVLRDYHVGLMLASAGKDADAIPYLEKAVANRAVAAALTVTYMRAVEALARSQARTGAKDAALETINSGLELISDHQPLIALQNDISGGATIQPLIKTPQQGAAEIFFNVGSAISRQGSLPFAQSHLQLAHYLDGESVPILYALGNVFQGQEKFTRANSYYTEIPETSPFYRNAQLELALNYNQLKDVDEAEKLINAVIERNPDDFTAVSMLGGIYAQYDRFADAAALYDRAIARISNPSKDDWNLFYRRGIAFERTKQWEKAEADFKKALELSPDEPDVLNYLGYSWVDMGINLDEGLAMIRKAVELRPNAGFIIDSLGWAYYRLGKYEEAVEQLERALQLMPTDPVVNDHLGDAYWQVGRRLEATFQWKHALSDKPSDVDREKIEQKLQSGLTN
jgi:tetratricopeptide (TPR) repeat protein